MIKGMMVMSILRISASIILLVLNFIVLEDPDKRISAYYIIIPCRSITLITDSIMIIVFHRLMYWFLKKKLEYVRRKYTHGVEDVSCKTHLKILWVLVLTCAYTFIDFIY